MYTPSVALAGAARAGWRHAGAAPARHGGPGRPDGWRLRRPGPLRRDRAPLHHAHRSRRHHAQRAGVGPLVLAVDMAVSPDGKQVAVVSAGNATNGDIAAFDTTAPALTRVFLTDLDDVTDPLIGCSMDGKHAPCSPAVGRRPRRADTSTGAGGAIARAAPSARAGSRGTAGSVGPCCAPPSTGGAGGTGGRVGAGGAIGRGGAFGSGGAFGGGGDRDRGQRRCVHLHHAGRASHGGPGRRGRIRRIGRPDCPVARTRDVGPGATVPPSRCRRSAARTRAIPCSTPTRAGSWPAPRATRKATRTDGPGTSAARGRAARNRSRLGWPAPSHSTGTATRPTSRTS